MSEIQEARNDLTTSLEHADNAHDLASELKELQGQALGYGGVAQNQLEVAVNGLPYYMNQVKLACENSSHAFDDSKKAVQLLTHGEALSKGMGDLDELADTVSAKLFYANLHREAALRNGADPLGALEAALDSFDLFSSRLNDATHTADTIGTEIGNAKAAITEVIPKNTGLVGIAGYDTNIKYAELIHNSQRGLLVGAENHIPEGSRQLVVDVIDGLKKSMGLLERVEDKNIEGLNKALIEAESVISPRHRYVPALKTLAESLKRDIDKIQRSGKETTQFQEITQTALNEGRKILAIL